MISVAPKTQTAGSFDPAIQNSPANSVQPEPERDQIRLGAFSPPGPDLSAARVPQTGVDSYFAWGCFQYFSFTPCPAPPKGRQPGSGTRDRWRPDPAARTGPAAQLALASGAAAAAFFSIARLRSRARGERSAALALIRKASRPPR